MPRGWRPGPVTLDFKAYGDLNFSTEIVDAYLNGVWIDQLFDADVVTNDCPADAPDEDQTVLTAAEYNAAAATGTITIEMIANYRVNPYYCTHPTWISVKVSYATEALSADCNANGIPDECDIAEERSTDANDNGVPDECEAAATCRGDCDCNGRITFEDITYFVAALGGYHDWVERSLTLRGAEPDCPWANCDANGDTLVNFEDINPFVSLLGTPCP